MSLWRDLIYLPPAPSERALRLHRETPVADLHVDCLLTHQLFGYDLTRRHRAWIPRSPFIGHYDLPRARDGGVQIWGLGLVAYPWPATRRRAALVDGQLDYLLHLETEHPATLFRITDAAALERGLAAGRIGALPGIEGAHIIGGDLGLFEHFVTRGIRYFGLTHFSSNEAASCAAGLRSSTTAGLTAFGRRLVERIEQAHLLLDLAHLNKPGFMEACAMLSTPPIVSHTGLSGLFPHWRNIDDEQLEAVARLGGVVGVIAGPRFLGGGYLGTLELMADAAEHVRRVVGVRHVALGSDMDGWIEALPAGLGDATGWPRLTEILIRRGWSDEELAAFLGDNVRRVLHAVLPAGKG
jgi:membrane dipeptidase